MNTSITQLSAREQSDLQRMTKILVSSLHPHFIYCYGSRRIIKHSMSCFAERPIRETRQYFYDLVIIIPDEEARPDTQLFALMKAATSICAKVHTILHRRAFVFEELENGNFFFSWLLRAGICLYSKDKLPMEGGHTREPAQQNPLYLATESQVRQLLLRGSMAWQEANKYQQENDVIASLVQVRVSFSCSLRALLLGYIGYRPAFVPLSVLLGFTRNISPMPSRLLPDNTLEEGRLFLLIAGKTAERESPPTAAELDVLLYRAAKMNRVVALILANNKSILKFQRSDKEMK